MRTNRPCLVLMLAALVLGFGGCGMRRSMQVARQAVDQFHAQLDKGDTKGIAASSDARFKAAASGEDFTALLDRIHQKLGPVRSTSEQSWHYNYNNGVTDVVVDYRTRFAAGDATETFTFQVNGEKATLRDYKIDNPEVAAPKTP